MLQGFTNKYFNILFQEMCIPQYVKTKRQKKKKTQYKPNRQKHR